MEDNDIEDVSFLPGDTRAHKKSVYEPSGTQRCRQIICSRNKAIAAMIGTGIVILAVALFAAFARPVLHPSCPVGGYFANESSTPSPVEKTTPEQATDGEKFPWQNIRLPINIIPESYHIFMHPNLTESWFRGKIEMRLRVAMATDFIVFHKKDLNITSHNIRHDGPRGDKSVGIVKALESVHSQQYYMELDSPLQKGDYVLLTVEFKAALISKLAGFYKSTYKTDTNESRTIATTHFEPTDARAAFPCFDEPDFKANFTMHMVRDRHLISLFNMPLVQTVPYQENDELVVDQFQTSVQMSTYLVAFVVCDFANLTAYTKSGVKVRVFAPSHVVDQASFALESAVKILDHYDAFFHIKYPLPKQDLIAIPDFSAGAMENWGLITYRMTSILYDPKETSVSNQQWVAIVVAHELAHQWFGNLVTMKWWNDLWLNEGFASFVEFIGADIINPDWKLYDQFVSKNLLKAMNLDSLSNSHPIDVPVQNPNQINEIFDTISYDKGSSILRMLQNFIGMDEFKSGLHNYLQKYSYENTVTEDLWNCLSEVSEGRSVEVKKVMDTWTGQMGYPVVSLEREGNTVKATQTRFLLYYGSNVTTTSDYGYKWYVPLTYATSVDPSPSSAPIVWMNMSSATFQIPAETKWLKANYKMYGFYRVNYDEEMWNELINVMTTNHQQFSGGDRAGLIDDAFSLARAGIMNMTKALELSKYLVSETEYVPWVTAISSLNYIHGRLLDSNAYDDFVEFNLNLLDNVVKYVGWEDTGSHLKKYLRTSVLGQAIQLGHPQAVQDATQRFKTWMSEGKSLPANLRLVIYVAGVQYGGQREWEYCWNRYMTTQVASEKRLMLQALGSSKDTMLLSKYLRYSLDPSKIRSQDISTVIAQVAWNPAGRHLAWRFVRENWTAIQKGIGSGLFTGSAIIRSATSLFSSQFDLDEAKLFFAANSVTSGKRAVKQALESIQMNMDWLQKNEETVAAWLKVHKKFSIS